MAGPFSSLRNSGRPGGAMGNANSAVRVEVDGAEELAKQFEAMPRESVKALNIALWGVGQMLRRYIVDAIRKPPKTGRIYKRGKRVRHRASAQGEWPAADTGNMNRLIQSVRVPNELAVDVENNSAYGVALEMKPASKGGRPHMSRGFNDKVEEAVAMIEAALNAVLPGDRTANRK